jgi:hypothetical protein
LLLLLIVQTPVEFGGLTHVVSWTVAVERNGHLLCF